MIDNEWLDLVFPFVRAPDALFILNRVSFVPLAKQNGREQQSGIAQAEGFTVTAGAGANRSARPRES
jgi:hypothetical protein